MRENWKPIFDAMLKSEGGYVNHPNDPGGPTNLGVTQAKLSEWLGRKASINDVKALTPAGVEPLYRKDFWDSIRGDDLPSGVDYVVFDYGVNSGQHRAIISLQRCLKLADDGRLGPITLRKVKESDPSVLVSAICSERLAFMRKLSTWPTFGKGWARRVKEVQAKGLAMVEKGHG